MKKLFFILFILSLNACNYGIIGEEVENHKTISRKESLSQIHEYAKQTLANLQDKEKKHTLSEEEKNMLDSTREVMKSDMISDISKYSARPISLEDTATILMATAAGYSFYDITTFLGLDFFVDNLYCEHEYSKYKIFQVLSDYVLASGCDSSTDTYCYGRTVAILKEENELYFDNKFLAPQNEYCATYIGIHQYEGKDGNYHTVPILEFFPKNIGKDLLAAIENSRKANK